MVERLIAQQDIGDAAIQAHGADGDHDRRQVKTRHQDTVEQAAQQTHPNPTNTSSGVSIPAAAQKPIAVELSAIVEATDRSISRAIISIAIGRTTIAFSVKVKVASDRFQILRK